MRSTLAFAVAACTVVGATARPVMACGGVVQPQTGTVAQRAQLAVLALNGANTDVILTLDVPDAANSFGVLVPVPAEPTLDPDPIDVDLLALLEERTRPAVGVAESGIECGCPGFNGAGGDPTLVAGVEVGEAVAIGPVTAQWLSGENGAAVTDYLSARGFVLPAGGQAIVDEYVAQGLSFVSFTRNDSATGSARVGVRFTLDGDRRAYALKMATLGATASLSFTIFVAAPEAVGADAPYRSLTVADLDADLAQTDYPQAVRSAVQAAGGKAFVVETWARKESILYQGELDPIIPDGTIVTRLSSVADPGMLDADVSFTTPAPEGTLELFGEAWGPVHAPPEKPRPDLSLLALFALLAVLVVRRRDDAIGMAPQRA